MNLLYPTNLHSETHPLTSRVAVATPTQGLSLYSGCSLKGRAICFIKCLTHIRNAVLKSLVYLVMTAISAVALPFILCVNAKLRVMIIKSFAEMLACTVVAPAAQLALAVRAAAGILHPAAYFKKGFVKIDPAFETSFMLAATTHIPAKTKNIQFMFDVLTGRKQNHRPGRQLQKNDDELLFPQIYQMLIEIDKEFNKPGKVSDDRKKAVLNDIADIVKECHPAWYSRVLELHLTIKEPDNKDERVPHYAHLVLNASFNYFQILLNKYKRMSISKMPDFHVVNIAKIRFAKELNIDVSKIKYDYFLESWEKVFMVTEGHNDNTLAAMLLATYKPENLIKEVSERVNGDHNQDLRSHLLIKLHEADKEDDQLVSLKKYTKNNHYQGPLNELAIRKCLKTELDAFEQFKKKYQSIWDYLQKNGLDACIQVYRTP